MTRVLVTRPQPAAGRTADRLAALGHQPLVLPLAEAEHDPVSALDALRHHPAVLAVTSAETLRVLGTLGAALNPYFGIPLFAVGTATADAARQLGFLTVFEGGGTGGKLAELVVRNAAAPVLYLAGAPRLASLETALNAAGLAFSVCECYRMRDIDYPAETIEALLFDAAPQAVLLYSPESARRLFGLRALTKNPSALSTMRFLCLSEAVARAIPEPLRPLADISGEPTEDSLFTLL